MTEFITIIPGVSAPAAAAVTYDKAMIVGDGSAHLALSKMYAVTNEDWTTTLEDDGFSDSDQLYKSVADFFAASPTPDSLYVFAFVEGGSVDYEDVPLIPIDSETWEIPSKPPAGWGPGATGLERVRFYYPTTTGYQWNYSNGATGLAFTVEKDYQGNWNGRLKFPNGLTGTSGAIVKPITAESLITVDFTIGSKGNISEIIQEYDINMVTLALANTTSLKNYSSNVFGTSQVDDLDTMMTAISGKQCMFIYAMPGDATPSDLITGGGGLQWKDLKSIVGQREEFVNLKSKPSVTADDMAAGYMGMCMAVHPHTGMSFARPHMAIYEAEPKITQGIWKKSQTNYVIQKNFLAGAPFMIVRGFTFGTDANSNRIDIVRCKYIIIKTLRNGMWSLLASQTVRTNYKGCVKIEDAIRGIFAKLIAEDIVDSLEYVEIPLKDEFLRNTAAARAAAAAHKISGIRIGYRYDGSLEELEITALINEAV